MAESDSEPSKGTDLAAPLREARPVIIELSTFMQSVRPLLSERDDDLEAALKTVASPNGKGLKNILTFIDNRVSFIANKLAK